VKEEIERFRTELERAQRRGELGNASEIQYGRIPELEKKLADLTAKSAKTKKAFATRRSDRGGHRRGRLELDGHSGFAFAGGRAREARKARGAFAPTRRGPGRSDQGRG
jgi:hypothetical protein